ncbi:hypothetical protein D5018_07050 [Parashewanella curva]|uniref:DNA-binding protein n=1 Tax=Parashewanella curva TaxID=2338552 RepID=A0A3L8Q0R6_9GAMM|nr:hypothetical protein D5018_07050 [Parashewanella curva]
MINKETVLSRSLSKQIWFTNAQLCEHFGIHRATLCRWKRHRRFPQAEIRLTGRERYDIRKINAFLQSKL